MFVQSKTEDMQCEIRFICEHGHIRRLSWSASRQEHSVAAPDKQILQIALITWRLL